MPKRAPTPPPTDDSLFFTVINPYPQQPYLSPEDSETFARWIACVIGSDNFVAFWHKPKVSVRYSYSLCLFGELNGRSRNLTVSEYRHYRSRKGRIHRSPPASWRTCLDRYFVYHRRGPQERDIQVLSLHANHNARAPEGKLGVEGRPAVLVPQMVS